MLRKAARLLSWMFLAAFFALCGLVAVQQYEEYRAKSTANELAQIRLANAEENEGKPADWSNGMLELNPDYKGWLTVYGTNVNYPVVYSGDNEKYMHTDFYGEYASAGTLFLDETTDFASSGNLIIYGHKMKNKTMFGSLDSFKDQEFFQNNGIIRYEDEAGKHYFKVFALMVLPGSASAAEFIDLQAWSNTLEEDAWSEMLETIQSRASLFQEGRQRSTFRYLFLVTCDYTRNNGRLVIVAKSLG